MNKVVYGLVVLAFFMASCSSKKEVVTPSGTVTLLSPKKAQKEIAKAAVQPTWLKMVASVEVIEDGSRQNGTADLRLRTDSIVWVELMDPLIGIKAARAFAMADTVAFLNRIERTYFAGSYAYVETRLGTSIPFAYIFKLFQGQLFMPLADVEITENNTYQLIGKTPEKFDFKAVVDPATLQCKQQILLTPTDLLQVDYANYTTQGEYQFPQKIVVSVTGQKSLKATFTVKSISTTGPYKVPFNISKRYERTN